MPASWPLLFYRMHTRASGCGFSGAPSSTRLHWEFPWPLPPTEPCLGSSGCLSSSPSGDSFSCPRSTGLPTHLPHISHEHISILVFPLLLSSPLAKSWGQESRTTPPRARLLHPPLFRFAELHAKSPHLCLGWRAPHLTILSSLTLLSRTQGYSHLSHFWQVHPSQRPR